MSSENQQALRLRLVYFMRRFLILPLLLGLSSPVLADDNHIYTLDVKIHKSNRLDKETLQRIGTVRRDRLTVSLDTFIHKGKEYIASRECEEGRSMQWETTPSFLGIGGGAEELGCMTPLELEAYKREKKLQRAKRPVIINNPAPVSQPIRSRALTPPKQTFPSYSSPFANN